MRIWGQNPCGVLRAVNEPRTCRKQRLKSPKDFQIEIRKNRKIRRAEKVRGRKEDNHSTCVCACVCECMWAKVATPIHHMRVIYMQSMVHAYDMFSLISPRTWSPCSQVVVSAILTVISLTGPNCYAVCELWHMNKVNTLQKVKTEIFWSLFSYLL